MRYLLIAIFIAGIGIAFISPVIGGVIAGVALLSFMLSRSALGGPGRRGRQT